MGRLTRRAESDETKAVYLYENTIDDTNCFLEGEYGYKAFEKLAAYEDIIDDPEKLKLIDVWYSELCKENGQLKKELAEYKKLEDEGLLLRLPCKVGSTVYHVVSNRILEVENVNLFFLLLSVAENRFGKTVFCTLEEAEQALERMKEVQDK